MLPAIPADDLLANTLFSMMALRRAWQQVRRSGPTAGSDGVDHAAFEAQLDMHLNRLRQHILNDTYRPHPVRRIFLKKPSGKTRPISVWTLRDRVAQRVLHDYLTPLLEVQFLPCSYGFRPNRSIEQAVKAIIQQHQAGFEWVLDADIADCFGSIPLDILTDQIRRTVPSRLVNHLIEAWLFTPIQGEPRSVVGVSQGGVISPLLANFYLHRFDEMITAALASGRLIRFADDFVILCRAESDAIWAWDVAQRSLENLKLTLNRRKTRIVTFEQGFLFLGVHFRGNQFSINDRPEGDEGGNA